MNHSLDSRSLFLEEFIKRIIIKSAPPRTKIEKKEALLEKLEEVVVSPPKLEIEQVIKPKQPAATLATQKAPEVVMKQPLPPAQPFITPIKSAQPAIMPKTIMPQAKPSMPQLPQMPRMRIMERLNRIFLDPSVQTLNCPGPNKNILVTRLGVVQTSQISFNENEIKEFMQELSEKTRIPLIPGLIKVIFQNLIITAVISEFVDTKFVAERRQQPPIQAPPRMPRMQFR